MFKRFINTITNTSNSATVKEGIVKFFNNKKGFGFITVKDTNEEIFVHSSNLIDKIRENDKVSFEVEQGEKGPSAVKVSLMK